jgi:hypothetical protein
LHDAPIYYDSTFRPDAPAAAPAQAGAKRLTVSGWKEDEEVELLFEQARAQGQVPRLAQIGEARMKDRQLDRRAPAQAAGVELEVLLTPQEQQANEPAELNAGLARSGAPKSVTIRPEIPRSASEERRSPQKTWHFVPKFPALRRRSGQIVENVTFRPEIPRPRGRRSGAAIAENVAFRPETRTPLALHPR